MMTQAQESGGMAGETRETAGRKIWVTLTGLPLTFQLEWPFHQSTSGADFWVLHGDIRLEESEGRHALVAVNLSQTVREVMPSLEREDAEAPVINALRKEVDRRQIEFVKSGKLLPVAFSSRHYDFKRQQWVFGKATDEAIAQFVERKVYWETKLGSRATKTELDGAPTVSGDARKIPRAVGESTALRDDAAVSPPPATRVSIGDPSSRATKTELGGAPTVSGDAREIPRAVGESTALRDDAAVSPPAAMRVWIGDPAEAQYLQTAPAHLMEIAGRLATQGALRIDGEWAEATPALMNQAERFESERQTAVEELEKKHAFERG